MKNFYQSNEERAAWVQACARSFEAELSNPLQNEYVNCIVDTTATLKAFMDGNIHAKPANFDDMKKAVEGLTNGVNTIMMDDAGLPSVMVALPKMNSANLADEFAPRTHPAWIMDGKELDMVYLSKYQNVVFEGRAYSLPLMNPATKIDIDAADAVCMKKGEGWGLTPAALWSALALYSHKNGTLPGGNSYYGADFYKEEERGIPADYSSASPELVYHTLTGSGPARWNHNGRGDGVADLCGNVQEWQNGARLMYGEFQMIRNADCMMRSISKSADSADWCAISVNGQFIPAASEESVKLDYLNNGWSLVTGSRLYNQLNSSRYCFFKDMTTELEKVPQLVKEFTLYPTEGDNSDLQRQYFSGYNGPCERMMYRGGSFGNGCFAGIFATSVNLERSFHGIHFGFRSAYYGE